MFFVAAHLLQKTNKNPSLPGDEMLQTILQSIKSNNSVNLVKLHGCAEDPHSEKAKQRVDGDGTDSYIGMQIWRKVHSCRGVTVSKRN